MDAVGVEDTGEVGGGIDGEGDDDGDALPVWVWGVVAVVALLIIGGVGFMVV